MSGVQRFVQPDYSDPSQSGSSYPIGIDRSIQVLARIGRWFAPHQVYVGSPNPDLAVELDPGFIWNGTTLTEVSRQVVGGFSIPSAGQHRIDRVVIDAATGVATRVAGTAVTGSPSAVAPAIAAGKIPNCQVLITSADTAVLNAMITDERPFPTSGGGSITSVTPQVWSSGVSLNFSGLPSGIKALDIPFANVSTNGTSDVILQIGDSGGLKTSGYLGGSEIPSTGVNYTTGFGIRGPSAAYVRHGIYSLRLIDEASFLWAASFSMGNSGATDTSFGGGSVALSGALDRFTFTTVGGTDAGDGGTVGAVYWR